MRELLAKALAVLEEHVEKFDYEQFTSICELDPAKDLIIAIREALAEQEPIGYVFEDDESYTGSMIYANKSGDEMLPVYLAPVSAPVSAPVDAKAIRAEALEEAAKWCEDEYQKLMNPWLIDYAAAIRGLK